MVCCSRACADWCGDNRIWIGWSSPAGVAVGAGIVLAAGGISLFNAIARWRFFLDRAAVRQGGARAAIDEARHATTSMPPRGLDATDTPLRNGSSPNNGTSRERSSELFDPR